MTAYARDMRFNALIIVNCLYVNQVLGFIAYNNIHIGKFIRRPSPAGNLYYIQYINKVKYPQLENFTSTVYTYVKKIKYICSMVWHIAINFDLPTWIASINFNGDLFVYVATSQNAQSYS